MGLVIGPLLLLPLICFLVYVGYKKAIVEKKPWGYLLLFHILMSLIMSVVAIGQRVAEGDSVGLMHLFMYIGMMFLYWPLYVVQLMLIAGGFN